MKKFRILLFSAIFVFTLVNAKINAQTSAQAEIFAEIIPAITATETAQLNFGRFSPTTQGGQVLITPDGSRMATGTVVLAEGPHQAARFYVTGEKNSAYTITLPETYITLTNVNNSKTMMVTDWVSVPPGGSGTGLLEDGTQEVRVGATLQVGSFDANPVGFYSGTFTIKFDYN